MSERAANNHGALSGRWGRLDPEVSLMSYLTWELESKLRKMADVLRDEIVEDLCRDDEHLYRGYGSYAFSLMLLKRLSDRFDERSEGTSTSDVPREQEQSRPLGAELVVPTLSRWSALKASENPSGALKRAASCLRKENPGCLGDSLSRSIADDVAQLGDRPGAKQLTRLVSCLDRIGLGDRCLKSLEDPKSSTYDAEETSLTAPVYEATGIFLEHLRIRSPLTDQPLWRYMCRCRFEELVEQRALWFSRSDTFDDDEFEGLPPGIDTTFGLPGRRRQFTFVNCWSQDYTESVAMWKLYGCCTHTNVAIQTDYAALQDSLRAPDQVYFGKIRYDTESILTTPSRRPQWDTEVGSISVHFMKRSPFSYEKEVRAVIQYPIPDHFDPQPPCAKGIAVPVDLPRLVKRVVVNPKADNRFIETIRSILQSEHLGGTVETSVLANSVRCGQTRPAPITGSQGTA